MGRRRKIFTKREYEKLSKTHEGRQTINKTYCSMAIFFMIVFISAGIWFVTTESLKSLAPFAFIGAGIALIVAIIFICLYRSENTAEQEHITKARIAEQQRIDKLMNSNMYEIDKMDGYEFEEFIKIILSSLGFNATITKKSGDFGVDLIVEKDNEKIIIQTKRYAKKVSVNAVQEITSAKNYYNIQSAWVITNNYFTEPAKQLAIANDIKIIDREELATLIIKAKNNYDNNKLIA